MKKKAMLSQPMAGRTEQEIIAARDHAIAELERRGYEVVNTLFTAVTKKKIPSKYEAWVHAAGMILLLGFMALVTFKDVWTLFQ